MANNTTLPGTGEVYRSIDRSGVKAEVVGLDVNIGGGSEQLMTAAALADGTSNPTIPTWAMCGLMYNGTTWDRIRGDTTSGLYVQEKGAALTSLQLIDDVVYTDDTSTHATGTSKGVLLMAAAAPTDTSVNANDIGAVAMTTDRKMHVSVQDALPAGANAIGKLAANSGVDIGALTANQTVNVAQINGVTPLMGNGASGTGAPRVTLASDSTGQVALAAGTAGIGKLTANAGVNIGDIRNRPATQHARFAIGGLTTVTTTYAVGDQAGTMIPITGAASANGGTGTLVSLAFLDKGDVGTDYRCHFFRSNVTLASDNAAFAVSDTDMQDWCGEVVVPSLRDLGANRAASLGNIGLGYDTGAGTTLYCGVETRTANAVYAAATDINITPYLVLD